MPSAKPSPVREEPEVASSQHAFALAERLRASAEPSERAIGEFVAHGLVSIVRHFRGPATRARWVSQQLPLVARALQLLGYALSHPVDGADAPIDGRQMKELLSGFLRALSASLAPLSTSRASSSDRFVYGRLAEAALHDGEFMVALSAGRAHLPVEEEIDDAIAQGLADVGG